MLTVFFERLKALSEIILLRHGQYDNIVVTFPFSIYIKVPKLSRQTDTQINVSLLFICNLGRTVVWGRTESCTILINMVQLSELAYLGYRKF